jgi:t-SNARE syntaxin family protein
MFASYLRIRSLATSKTSAELSEARAELETLLDELVVDLQDMNESVKAVQADPYRYGLEIEEVERRRRFVQEVGGEIEDIREEMAKPFQPLSQNEKGPRSAALAGLQSPSDFDMMSPGSVPDYIAIDEQQRQQEIMQEQDLQLEEVHHTVRNLREQAGVMGDELEDQDQLLEEVHDMTDRVGGKLKSGLKRVNWVMRNNEGKPPDYTITPADFQTLGHLAS